MNGAIRAVRQGRSPKSRLPEHPRRAASGDSGCAVSAFFRTQSDLPAQGGGGQAGNAGAGDHPGEIPARWGMSPRCGENLFMPASRARRGLPGRLLCLLDLGPLALLALALALVGLAALLRLSLSSFVKC